MSRILTALLSFLIYGSIALGSDVECHFETSIFEMIDEGCLCVPCDRCHFRFRWLTCIPLTYDDEDSDDVEQLAPFDQPLLQPTDWFLTHEELTDARGGVERQDLQLYSEHNSVQLFPSTDTFFASVYNDIEALEADASWIFVTGWSVDNIPFKPKKPYWQSTTFRSVFGRAIERNINVSVLVWANLLERAQNVAMQEWMNMYEKVDPLKASHQPRFLLDNRLPYPTSSHHQKTVVLNHKDQNRPTVAYVGGIDLTNDRWDTRFHNESRLRVIRGIFHSHNGWVDASLRLEGPAAKDVGANFLGRWNDRQPALQNQADLQGFTNPEVTSNTPISHDFQEMYGNKRNATNESLSLNAMYSSTSVQIVRTFSCKVGYEFAPRGEISLLNSRIKAIKLAKNYIYVEDQYFIDVPALREALLQQLPHIQALVIFAQLPALDTAAVGYGKLLYDMLEPLQAQFPDKVHAFTVKPTLQIYVHTKVLLIDDVFLSIGSGNWNQRSMTSDSEIAANVIDENVVTNTPDGVQVNALAREFRLRKFSEFSGVSVEKMSQMTFFDGLRAMEQATANKASLLRRLVVKEEVYFRVFPGEVQELIDPYDECV